jgi:hypothetical protein
MRKYLSKILQSHDLNEAQKRWLIRIAGVKRRFFFEEEKSKNSLPVLIFRDLAYLLKWMLNILLILRAHGGIIGLSTDFLF